MAWQISGDYFETCSCTFLCPCLPSNHPANSRVALARAVRSHLDAFGLKWDDASSQNNGHFAPFSWQG